MADLKYVVATDPRVADFGREIHADLPDGTVVTLNRYELAQADVKASL